MQDVCDGVADANVAESCRKWAWLYYLVVREAGNDPNPKFMGGAGEDAWPVLQKKSCECCCDGVIVHTVGELEDLAR